MRKNALEKFEVSVSFSDEPGVEDLFLGVVQHVLMKGSESEPNYEP